MSCRLWCVAAVIAAVSGCADCHWPKIDPSGEHVFAPTPVAPQNPANIYPVSQNPVAGDYRNSPGELTDEDDVLVTLSPETDKVAQVGSEVILVAGVGGADGLLKAHRRLGMDASRPAASGNSPISPKTIGSIGCWAITIRIKSSPALTR